MEKRWLIGFIVGLLMSLLVFTMVVVGSEDRIFGHDRFETAVEISKEGWPSADIVLLAVSDNFPDALAGAPLAYQLDAPILLTQSDRLNEKTKAEIERLGANEVIILGGTGVISGTVEVELHDMGIATVERLGGENRFETAKMIADRMGFETGRVMVVDGYNYPDALAIAPFAAKNGYPIVPVSTDFIPDHAQDIIDRAFQAYVIGGVNAVSDEVYEQLPTPHRSSGNNRFGTNVAILNNYYEDIPNRVFIATGMDFADSLTGSVLAAKEDVPFVLVQPNQVPNETYGLLYNHDYWNDFTVLGGQNAVSDNVISAMRNPVYDHLGFFHPNIDTMTNRSSYDIQSGEIRFRNNDYEQLSTNFNSDINRQVYQVTDALLDPETYVSAQYVDSGNQDAMVFITYANSQGAVGSGNHFFRMTLFENEINSFYPNGSPEFTLNVRRLYGNDLETAENHNFAEPYLTEKLSLVIRLMYSESTASKIYNYVLSEYDYTINVDSTDRHTTTVIDGVTIEMASYGYPRFHFYN